MTVISGNVDPVILLFNDEGRISSGRRVCNLMGRAPFWVFYGPLRELRGWGVIGVP